MGLQDMGTGVSPFPSQNMTLCSAPTGGRRLERGAQVRALGGVVVWARIVDQAISCIAMAQQYTVGIIHGMDLCTIQRS